MAWTGLQPVCRPYPAQPAPGTQEAQSATEVTSQGHEYHGGLQGFARLNLGHRLSVQVSGLADLARRGDTDGAGQFASRDARTRQRRMFERVGEQRQLNAGEAP